MKDKVLVGALHRDLGHIPKDIIDAAMLLSGWMAEHNEEYWQLGGVCDRRYAYREAATAEYSVRPRQGEVERRLIEMGWKE